MNLKKSMSVWTAGVLCTCSFSIAGDTIERSGDLLTLFLPVAAYGTTFYLDDQWGREQFYKSFASNAVVTYGLKYTIRETRPNEEDNHGFPSGHTSLAFQSAAFIHKRYGLNHALPTYIAAAFVGYSRIQSDNHYFHDVAAGALIGMASSFCFVTTYKGWYLQPVVSRKIMGLQLSQRFSF